jgi:phage protein D/phage baseplate assembly protein gpV
MSAATAQQSQQHVAGVDVLVNGAAMDPKWRDATTEVKVVDTLALPDMAVVKLLDPEGKNVDSQPFQLGAEIEIKAAALGDRSTTSIFKGQIAAVEPEFSKKGCVIVARAYDKSHKLIRVRKTRTFQQVSASDMIRKIAGENGLTPDVKATNVVHEFFQQSNETDWDFGWRLALMHDYELLVIDDKLTFRPANKAAGSPTTVKWQENLQSFRPRMSGIQQVDTVNVRSWDPKNKANVNGNANSATTTSQPGEPRAKVAKALGGGTTTVTDRVAASTSEANALAKSTLNRIADAFYEADGVAFGDPKIKSGGQVKVDNVGSKFGGTFTVSSVTHVYRGGSGYESHFKISGRSARTLLELIRPPEDRDWSNSLVVGLVTNNKDDAGMGRVRVKYPSLSDKEESAWARIATPSAGNARGLLMMPQPNEEVIVGFEHGDTRRPIVVGSLFNGRDKPGEELLQNKDGSFSVLSDQKIHQHSKKDFEIKSDENFVIEITKDEKEKVGGNLTSEVTGNAKLKAQQYVVEAGSSMTVKGVSVTVEASASLTLKGATVDIQGSGPVNIKGAIINLG